MPSPYRTDLFPPDFSDPLVEAFEKDVDTSLLIENLKLTTNERSHRFMQALRTFLAVKEAGERHRAKESPN